MTRIAATAEGDGTGITAERIERRSRLANKALRRQQLIDATLESVHQSGLADTTLAKVATLAGVSQGIVVFHFGTKDQLLVEALRFLSEEYRQVWQRELAKAGEDPINRLCAMVGADLQPDLISRKKLTVWHAFYGEAKAHPTYLEICGARDEEYAVALNALCAAAVAAAKAAGQADVTPAPMVADLLVSLTDGLWLGMLMSKWELGRNEALALMCRQLTVLFPVFAARFEAYLTVEQGSRKR